MTYLATCALQQKYTENGLFSNTKLNIDEPRKAVKVIDFFFLFLGLIESQQLVISLFACYCFKSCCVNDHDMDLTHILFSHNSLYLFWPTSGIKASTNEQTSWIRCFRWGRQCWGASGQFFKNHFRDIFLNVMHIQHIACVHTVLRQL